MKKIAAVFPGQGSQRLGMLNDVVETHAFVADLFNSASEILGYDLWQVVSSDEVKLGQTEYTQVALLVCDVALFQLWQRHFPKPLTDVQLLAGHSLGEYAALVAAGSLSFKDAVSLVQTRGRLMQQACQPGQGGMAAILGLEDSVVVDICQRASQGDIVTAANFNCPNQVVISGQKLAVQRAMALAEEADAKRVVPLDVSVPAHSEMMRPAVAEFESALANVKLVKPEVAVIQNVSCDITFHPDEIRQNLLDQLCGPVRWTETIQRMMAENVDVILECGPGRVLSGLNKRTASPETVLKNISDMRSFENTLDILKKEVLA